MIKGIEGFYIINQEDSDLILSYENTSSKENWDMEIFSSAVNALQNFAKHFGHTETKFMDFGGTRVYASVNEVNKLIYLLRCKTKFKDKRARDILYQLRDRFSENISSFQLSKDQIRSLKEDIFDHIVMEILNTSMDGFKQLE